MRIMSVSIRPGYRRTAEIKRPKLDRFTGFMEPWLSEDLSRNRKQRHTAGRVLERLRDEHSVKGGYPTVRICVREQGRRNREMFVPLAHAPGHAPADFGSDGRDRRRGAEGALLRAGFTLDQDDV